MQPCFLTVHCVAEDAKAYAAWWGFAMPGEQPAAHSRSSSGETAGTGECRWPQKEQTWMWAQVRLSHPWCPAPLSAGGAMTFCTLFPLTGTTWVPTAWEVQVSWVTNTAASAQWRSSRSAPLYPGLEVVFLPSFSYCLSGYNPSPKGNFCITFLHLRLPPPCSRKCLAPKEMASGFTRYNHFLPTANPHQGEKAHFIAPSGNFGARRHKPNDLPTHWRLLITES